jgi:hypothetical protein
MAERRSGGRSILYTASAALALSSFTLPASAIPPGDPGPGDVAFAVNSGQNVRAISPHIYGSNSSAITNRTADRSGGNRWTGYNWETNASQAGRDWYYQNDTHMGTGPPGNAVLGSLNSAAANNRALVVTVPTAGYVAGDTAGPVQLADVAPSSRWKEVVPSKSTQYPGVPLSTSPNLSDGFVFTDELVHWVESTKQPSQTVFYSLDNEPGLWGEPLPGNWQPGVPPPCPPCNPAQGTNPSPQGRTHGALHPYAPTYTEMRDKTIAHASAIKDLNPDAIVFGGVGYGWNEFRSLQDAPGWTTSPSHPGGDQGGELHYYEWLLNEMRIEETNQGRTLMDVLDLHWYPEARGNDNGGTSRRIVFDSNPTHPGVVAARVQAPRSLWDPTYIETSWITGCCTNGTSIRLLSHVQRDIDDFKPGTKIAITEYNYGATNHISGGIAQADFLGIVGREGVFAANWWDLGGSASFVNAAFNMFLNFDGAGGQFGDTSVAASTDAIAASSVYASVDATDPNRMVVVAINRTGEAQDAAIAVEHDRIFDHAEVYRLTSASSNPVRGADIELDLVNALIYSMPAMSVTTLVLISDGLPGDYNRDGTVDAADYTVWRDSLDQTGDLAADGNEDNSVDAADYALWSDNFGRSELIGGSGSLAAVVPEPTTFGLLTAACGFAFLLRRPRFYSGFEVGVATARLDCRLRFS